jgi:thiol-disulfide isomerase/thioredoxin
MYNFKKHFSFYGYLKFQSIIFIMDNVTKIAAKRVWATYLKFRELLFTAPLGVNQVFLYKGNPVGKLTSWCPPCREAYPDYIKAVKEYTGDAKFYVVFVGTKKEWAARDWGEVSPFKLLLPFLSGVPTVEGYVRKEAPYGIATKRLFSDLEPRYNTFKQDFDKYLPKPKSPKSTKESKKGSCDTASCKLR